MADLIFIHELSSFSFAVNLFIVENGLKGYALQVMVTPVRQGQKHARSSMIQIISITSVTGKVVFL